MNALAHAVEALYAPDGNAVIRYMAEEGMRALAAALPIIIERPRDRDARSEAQYGAWLCGACLGQVSMALHHKLCHVLGGLYGLPHAETHAVVLPHAIAYNAPAVPDGMARAGRALGTADVPRALWDLGVRLGVPRALADLGMPAEGIDRVAVETLASPYWNPRPMELDPIRALLREAYEGTAPAA
jgi:alcohol dehydrogenase class IV